ncbi:hypothetical protein LAZ67_10001098 [Cordylochernes scorpioides]|uniref:Reverse transcriptase domain-containing protein n=1 Tax=Cordylochernes scorpioides TaxID=51811 RepID=A0ABY6KZB4_9ARAC|nr:hypothetical protein LAZ67_10001098 [Cordylochernes scorpioides]
MRQGSRLNAALFSIGVWPFIRHIESIMGRRCVVPYADDIALFIRHAAQFGVMLLTFEEFRMASGVVVNFDKNCGLCCRSWKYQKESPLGIIWTSESLSPMFHDHCRARGGAGVLHEDGGVRSSTIGRWLDYREGVSESILDWLVVKSATIGHVARPPGRGVRVIHHRSGDLTTRKGCLSPSQTSLVLVGPGHPPQVRWLDYRKGISVSGSVLPRLKVASGSISTPRNHQREIHPKSSKFYGNFSPSISTVKKWAALNLNVVACRLKMTHLKGSQKTATTLETIEKVHNIV